MHLQYLLLLHPFQKFIKHIKIKFGLRLYYYLFQYLHVLIQQMTLRTTQIGRRVGYIRFLLLRFYFFDFKL